MKLVVKQHRPVRKFLAISLTVIVLVLCGWLLVDYDQWQYIYARMTSSGHQAELHKAQQSLDLESQLLREQLERAERARQIDQLAYQEAGKIIKQQQLEIQMLKEELAFFQQLMGKLQDSKGLVIQELRLDKTDSDHSQDYTLVLTHIKKDDSVARGKFDIRLKGSRAGKMETLKMEQLIASGQETINFEFKHFTQLTGRLKWPEAFQPEEIQVRIWLKINPRKPYTKAFSWSELTTR